jgi:hypothetical protein
MAASEVGVARALVERFGGRFSVEMRISVERGAHEVDRWFLAATLFGTRISWPIVERTFAVLTAAGVRTIAGAGKREWDELVGLLDAGGYARYDERTATRLLELARVVRERHGRISALSAQREPAGDEAAPTRPAGADDRAPALRELRGVWPAATHPSTSERRSGGELCLPAMRPRSVCWRAGPASTLATSRPRSSAPASRQLRRIARARS